MKGGKKMKIAIIGGSGFVGQALIKQAIKQNIEVQYVSRHQGDITHPLVTFIQGDIFNWQQWQSQLETVDVIIHAVGAIMPKKALQHMNVDSIDCTLQLCHQHNINKVVYLSAENGPKHYIASHRQGEDLVKASGLHYLIVKPGLMYGSMRRWSLVNSIALDMALKVPIAKAFAHSMKPLPVDYVAEYILYCLTEEPTRQYLTLTQMGAT